MSVLGKVIFATFGGVGGALLGFYLNDLYAEKVLKIDREQVIRFSNVLIWFLFFLENKL